MFVRESLQDEQFVCLILGATCNLIGYLEERQIQEVSKCFNEFEFPFQNISYFQYFNMSIFFNAGVASTHYFGVASHPELILRRRQQY